jgi:hypothetical protein
MQADHPDDYNEPIHDVCETLDRVNTDLAAMPGFKRNTAWHTDRLAARRRLMAQRQYLRDRQQELLRAVAW